MSFGLSLKTVQPECVLTRESRPMANDFFAAAHEGWSPAELAGSLTAAGSCDILAPSHECSSRQCCSLQPSMTAHVFETLHSFWDPLHPAHNGEGSSRAVFAAAKVTCVSLGTCDRGGNKSIGSKLSRYIDPLNTLWAPSSADDQQALLDACHQTELFRLVIDLGWRKVVVDRGARQAGVLLQAMRYSFPSLMVPFCETAPDHSALMELVMVVHRAEALVQSYLPCLFFFFEPNPRQVVHFFTTLESTLKARIQADDALFPTATAKQRSSWLPFGWGQSPSDKASGVQMSPGDETQFVDTNGNHLGPHFKKLFVSSLHLHDVACDVSTNTEALDRAIEGEIGAYHELADALTNVQASLSAPPPWITDSADLDDAPPTMKETLAVVAGFTSMVSLLHTQVTLSMVEALVGASTTFYRCAVTQRTYVKSGVATAKFVVDKEPLMSGKESLANTPAGANPAVLAQMKVLYARKRSSLRSFLKQMPEEVASANARLREPLVVLCRNLLSLHRSIFHASDAAHHTTSRGSSHAEGSEEHPAMASLRSIRTDRLQAEVCDATQ